VSDLYQVVRRPLLTEKSDRLRESDNQYCFEVDKRANKHQIKAAIEELFQVKVKKVRAQNVQGKIKTMGRYSGKRADWKKAFVTLNEGEVIELFEGV
jgi:large subunit ribosomal protein L23